MTDAAFWTARWDEGKIGFHEGKPNDLLVRHGSRLGAHRNVLVPLCGKAEDLAWLAAAGHRVVGVELVESAVRAFFAEHQLAPTVDGNVYRGANLTLIAGDLFTVSRELTGPIDAIYDRAALVAMPPELRARYAAHVRGLAAADARIIAIVLDHDDPTQLPGPPFAISDRELRACYGDLELVEQRHDERLNATEKCWASR